MFLYSLCFAAAYGRLEGVRGGRGGRACQMRPICKLRFVLGPDGSHEAWPRVRGVSHSIYFVRSRARLAQRPRRSSKMAVAKRVTASGGARESSFDGLSRETKRFGRPVRSRGARPMASCHGSSSKAARAPVERFLTTAKMPPEATSKHASHPNGMRSRPWLVRRRPAAAALRWGRQRRKHTRRHAS